MKVILAGEGAFGVKHLEAIRKIEGVGRGLPRRRQRRQHPRGGRAVQDPPLGRWTSPRGWRSRASRAAILATPTGMHTAQAIQCLEGRQACAGRDPDGRQPGRRRAPRGPSRARSDRVAMAGPHAALQSLAPVGPQEDPGRRAEGPADGHPDLLLPPQQHERARPAALVDRPPALAPRLPLGGTSSSTRPARPARSPAACRGRCTPTSASPWTCRSR